MSSINSMSQEQLKVLSDEVVEQFEELLEVLGVELKKDNKMYYGPCPVHGGDRHNAINIYHTGDSFVGNWVCNSHQCQDTFQPTIVGFVRGVLSRQHLNWEDTGDDLYPFNKTVEFLLTFLKKDYDNLKVDLTASEKKKSANYSLRFYNRQKKVVKNQIARPLIRSALQIPSEYYLDRGFSRKILEKYDVGDCTDTSKPMYKRCVVPIYDDDHKFMVGCTGRSLNPGCDECKYFHPANVPCPLEEDKWKYCKWRHSKGFNGEEWLYNLWYAKPHIFQQKCAVLVESPGNVWKLEEAGIKTSLALFGTALSEGQLDALNKCGALNVILIPDNDKAGTILAEKTTKELEKLYNVRTIQVTGDDIGEMPVDILRRDIVPDIQGDYIE